jgi:hypothetical protein
MGRLLWFLLFGSCLNVFGGEGFLCHEREQQNDARKMINLQIQPRERKAQQASWVFDPITGQERSFVYQEASHLLVSVSNSCVFGYNNIKEKKLVFIFCTRGAEPYIYQDQDGNYFDCWKRY